MALELILESYGSSGRLGRMLRARRLRQQIRAIHEGARYWRRRGRPDTAAELERVAAFIESLVEPVPLEISTERTLPR